MPPTRGRQFALVNEDHFQTRIPEHFVHQSEHGDYTVHHEYMPANAHGGGMPMMDEQHGWGEVSVEHRPTGRYVGRLRYAVETARRATSLKTQPLIHTENINVDEDHQGKGLTRTMHSVLGSGHPGAPVIAANELTTQGAEWRAHLARTSSAPHAQERVGWDSRADEQRVYRPANGAAPDALMHPGYAELDDSVLVAQRPYGRKR